MIVLLHHRQILPRPKSEAFRQNLPDRTLRLTPSADSQLCHRQSPLCLHSLLVQSPPSYRLLHFRFPRGHLLRVHPHHDRDHVSEWSSLVPVAIDSMRKERKLQRSQLPYR